MTMVEGLFADTAYDLIWFARNALCMSRIVNDGYVDEAWDEVRDEIEKCNKWPEYLERPIDVEKALKFVMKRAEEIGGPNDIDG